MSTHSNDPGSGKGGFLGRLFGLQQEKETEEQQPVAQQNLGQGETPESEAASQPSEAESVAAPGAGEVAEAPPTETSNGPESEPSQGTAVAEGSDQPVKEDAAATAEASVAVEEAQTETQTAEAAPSNCPACSAELEPEASFCGDCGFSLGSADVAAGAATIAAFTPPQFPVKDRYQLGKQLSERVGIYRFEGTDLKHESGEPQPVYIIVGAKRGGSEGEVAEADVPAAEVSDDDLLPDLDESVAVAEEISSEGAQFPSVGWFKNILEKAAHPSLPRILDYFAEGDFEYLVLEAPKGQIIWDAWWDGDTGTRYGWLIQIAEAMRALKDAGAMLEGLQPDFIMITDDGRAVVVDVTDLLPLPLPENIPIKGSLYTAPELLTNPEKADARAMLYSFGATLYSLEYLGHNLEEKDFEKPFSPILITERFPDVHPAFNRLIIKTFVRDLNTRFPTVDAEKVDPSGLTELIETLQVCKRNFERVRLDIAAWTTTGMVRTNNEDAFSFIHACESRMDDVYDHALVILCDGMGGYEAGEVAAAMTIELVREYLLKEPMFAALAGRKLEDAEDFDVEKCKQLINAALKHANKEVYTEARRPGSNRRGMGCTADVVYIRDGDVVVGHVGDSRVYHVSNATIKQLTRDQTLVNRLVELGVITPEEAEDHERKNELQQAIGGQPDVDPGLYTARLSRNDWVLVCSDGLTGHIKDKELEEMLTRETSSTAEDACRRLLNLVNLRGATDNSTIVLVRAS